MAFPFQKYHTCLLYWCYWTWWARSNNYSRLVGKTFVCRRVGNKCNKNSGAFYLSEISRGPVGWGIPSKTKGTLLCLILPITKKKKKKERHKVLWASLDLGGNMFLIWVCHLGPFREWSEKLLVLSGSQNKTLQHIHAVTQAALLSGPHMTQQVQWHWRGSDR